MDKHPTCQEEGCQLKAGKGYLDCEQHSGACDLLRSLPVSNGLQPEAHRDAMALGGCPVALPLGACNPDVYTHAGRVFKGGSTPAPLGLVHKSHYVLTNNG